MAANFAPYQDIPPEAERALSPPPSGTLSPRIPSPRLAPRITSPRASLDTSRILSPRLHAYEQQDYFQGQSPVLPVAHEASRGVAWSSLPGRGFGRPREDVDMFTTSLGWRLDYEACLAYLLLPPAGGVLLLVLEHKSDYVRFHAWQSSLLFAFMFVVHVIFSWSGFVSWVLFVADVGLMGWLTYRAYVDAAMLDRCEVPFFGRLASSILDDE